MYGKGVGGREAWQGEAYQLVIASSPPSAEIAAPLLRACAHIYVHFHPVQSFGTGGDGERLPRVLNRCRKLKKKKKKIV